MEGLLLERNAGSPTCGTVSKNVSDFLESTAVLNPDDVLIPRRVGDRTPITNVNGIVDAERHPPAELDINDVGGRRVRRATSNTGGANRICRKRTGHSFESAHHIPAKELNDWCEFEMLVAHELITWADAVEEKVARKRCKQSLVVQQGRLEAIVVRTES